MSGFLGDLSDKQELALKELKERLKDIWRDDFTEPYLLRWLRAREFDVTKAENLIRGNLQWRRENHVDSFTKSYKPPEVLERYFPGGVFNYDREGNPVWIMPYGDGDFRGMLQCVSREEMVKKIIHTLEIMEDRRREQTKKLGRLVDRMTLLFDYENLSLKQISCLQAIDYIRSLVVLYENYYPETLHRAFFVNTPGIFPIFWRFIRPFISQRTADKVSIFTREGWQKEVMKYIDPSQLPAHYGGEVVGPPDGDPKCSDIICPGGEIPHKYYWKNIPRLSASADAVTRVLEPGDTFEVPFEVHEAGAILHWKFQTKSCDLAFAIFHVPPGGGDKSEVLKLKRVSCNHIPESGQLECSETGTYVFKFDNGFSWLTNKELSYIIRVDSSIKN